MLDKWAQEQQKMISYGTHDRNHGDADTLSYLLIWFLWKPCAMNSLHM